MGKTLTAVALTEVLQDRLPREQIPFLRLDMSEYQELLAGPFADAARALPGGSCVVVCGPPFLRCDPA